MKTRHVLLGLFLVLLMLSSCDNQEEPANGEEVKLILGAYTTPREAYGQIIPLFQND
jgi:ABC-type sulfate transport system substrate-binding protein